MKFAFALVGVYASELTKYCKKKLRIYLFTFWCILKTFFDALFGAVTKTDDGTIYLASGTTIIALFPATRRFSFQQYREAIFTQEKKYIKPYPQAFKDITGLFSYNERLRNSYIIVDNQTTEVHLIKYSLTQGFQYKGIDHQDDISHMIHTEDRTPHATNAKFYFPILVS
jgi:hypothetical protein